MREELDYKEGDIVNDDVFLFDDVEPAQSGVLCSVLGYVTVWGLYRVYVDYVRRHCVVGAVGSEGLHVVHCFLAVHCVP